MRRLSSLDTQFLNIESGTTTGHVGSLVVVDPPTSAGDSWGLDAVRALVEERLHLAPVLRQRLVEVPLGVARPYWTDDPSFELDHHLRELALPAPGSQEQLGDQVARLHRSALDRSRPPWELTVITGLAGGRVAVYTKIHHAAVDGVSGAALLGVMVGADLLVVATDVPQAVLRFGTPEAEAIGSVTLSQMQDYAAEGHFASGSMGPKVDAVCRFVQATDLPGVITSLDRIVDAVNDVGAVGTVVVPD